MALVGKVLTKPADTTSRRTYKALAVRCLLCGTYYEYGYPPALGNGTSVAAACDCYTPFIQPVRIVPE
jgi:hypothetical protein